MKNQTKTFIVSTLGLMLLFYILGAFYNASFIIPLWDIDSRAIIATTFFFMDLALCIAILTSDETN